jgi:CRISPR-associated helicase Cas3, subtype Dpsyc
VRSPLQPTIITTTVDQIGSRLLFRGYGVSDTARPIHASLAAIDSLVILDEAHISRPFEETMDRIRRFAAGKERTAVGRPVQFVTMSATPREGAGASRVFELGEADRSHPELGKRLGVTKLAKLREVATKGSGGKDSFRTLIEQATADAKTMLTAGRARIGVIVNRVSAAREIARKLREQAAAVCGEENAAYSVELLTGRMRPVDRDAVTRRLDRVRSNPAADDDTDGGGSIRPVVVVATQTIEVGADLDFDALITECASLDALRQRFGRLNRVGRWTNTDAVILTRDVDVRAGADDPIYGTALAATWAWLRSHASQRDEDQVLNMSAESIGRLLERTAPNDVTALTPPQPRAAALLLSHMNILCQTEPEPVPTPDVGPFLRGPSEASTDLSVVFRADLGDDPQRWGEIVALCPPSSTEALPVRIGEMRRWLRGQDAVDPASSDLEGQTAETELRDTTDSERCALAWHREEKERRVVSGDEAGGLYPGMVLVVPVSTDDQRDAARLLGDLPVESFRKAEPDADTGDEEARVQFGPDVGDEAFCVARDRLVLRLHSEVYPGHTELFRSLGSPDLEDDELDELITEAIEAVTTAVRDRHRSKDPAKLVRALKDLGRPQNRRVQDHPLGGVVVTSRRRLGLFDPTDFDERDRSIVVVGRDVRLHEHASAVASCARTFADAVPMAESLRRCVEMAAWYHDIGKADPRFQAMLRGGNGLLAEIGPPLAKSERAARGRGNAEHSGWPRGERHEFYSLRMVEAAMRQGSLEDQAELAGYEADLVLHLIAAHHGHARPFAPVAIDDEAEPAEAFEYSIGRETFRFDPVQTSGRSSGHGYERIDSGVAERFWRLTRRYGWWGLAYLESLVRLADWKASEEAEIEATVGDAGGASADDAPIGAASGVVS